MKSEKKIKFAANKPVLKSGKLKQPPLHNEGLRLKSSSATAKIDLLNLVQNTMDCGAKIGRHIFVGFNSVLAALERDSVAVVCLSRDVNPSHLLSYIVSSAKQRKVTVTLIPKLRVELADVLKVKSASAFAVAKYSRSDFGDDSAVMLDAKIDALRDYLQQVGSTSGSKSAV